MRARVGVRARARVRVSGEWRAVSGEWCVVRVRGEDASVGLTCGEACHSERWRLSALVSAYCSFGAKDKQLTGSAWPAECAGGSELKRGRGWGWGWGWGWGRG